MHRTDPLPRRSRHAPHMRAAVASVTLLWAAAASGAGEPPEPQAPPAPPAALVSQPSIAGLAWLAGCWQADTAATLAEGGEQWTPVLGHALLGVGWSAPGGRLRTFEFMQITENGAGDLVFVAQPQGQPPTTFTRESASVGEISFASPAHDFPSRVSYQALPGQRLLARIQGSEHGTPRALAFPLHRVACPTDGALHPR